MFKNVIVKRPCRSMTEGITSANLGKPDYDLALRQHDQYTRALEQCGCRVTVMDADERFPDSVFVEDTAVLTEKCAIITNPGAKSRQGEVANINSALTTFYQKMEVINSPGCLDGGDVMRTGDHFYVGLSERTNTEGVKQFDNILKKYGYSSTTVRLEKMLHLKTGLAYLENNNLLITGEFVNNSVFSPFNKIIVENSESYAANCIWVNGVVLVPFGFEQTKQAIEGAGYDVVTVDVSEFRKLDGGLSCLSLRF